MRLFRPLAALSLGLYATTALAGGLGEMTGAERDAFRAEVRQYLLDNPEVLVEAMNELQARQDSETAQADLKMLSDNKDAIYNSKADWAGGNPQGDITLVEFMDYRCGYCRKAYQEVEDLVKSDGNIRFVLKEFPILGEGSMVSAKFAIAVRMLHGDDAYKRAHDELITLKGDATPDAMAALARKMKLDPAPILANMDSAEVMQVIADNHKLAEMMELNGTPAFVIDKTMVRGYVPLEGMRQIVAGQRKG